MAHMLIKHHVRDYAVWRAVFDDNANLRAEYGATYAHVFRNADDPDNVVVMFRWDDLDNARRYAVDPRLKAAMQEAGVIGPPEVIFLAETESHGETAPIRVS